MSIIIRNIISYIRQGRDSRSRSRAGGFRWTLRGWTAQPRDTIRARLARSRALREGVTLVEVEPGTYRSGNGRGPLIRLYGSGSEPIKVSP